MFKGRSLGIKISISAIIAGGSTVLLMIVGGIIGGRADALFVALWEIVSRSITANSWPWIIVLILFLSLSACICAWWLNSKAMNSQLATLNKDLETSSKESTLKDKKLEALSNERAILDKELGTLEKVVKLDDSILRLLPNLISPKDRENEVRRLLKKLLEDTCGTFAGDVDRASLYLPDPKTGNEYLTFWEGYQMPRESILRTRFYIGAKAVDKVRGLAGEAFFYHQVRVGHINKENNRWHADNSSYIDFDKTRPYPPYRSLVSVPLIVGENASDCLGVMCFDSENATAFDSSEVQAMLLKLGARIAAVLLIYQQLKTIR
jgi:hypothetical protein